MSAQPSIDARHWRARLQLTLRSRGGRTVVDRCSHYGPLRVQRTFYPEGEPAHVYLLHPPGGIVGGDRLEIEVRVHEAAHALLTTPASTKFYRSDGRLARQSQRLRVDAGGALEWLPQDSIVFDGGLVDTGTRVDLEPGARFVGWEVFSLGRPASGERFEVGSLRQRLEVWRDQVPLVVERTAVDGAAPLLDASWGLQGQAAFATLIATPADARTLERARAAVTDQAVAFSLKGDVLLGRALGRQGRDLQLRLASVWSAIRPMVMGRSACQPRIWNT